MLTSVETALKRAGAMATWNGLCSSVREVPGAAIMPTDDSEGTLCRLDV